MVVIAHVSDTHFDGTARAAARVARVMSYLNTMPVPVDLILVTGDIADNGLPAEYEEARKTLVSSVPLAILPGNHDVRTAMRTVLLDEEPSGGPINRTVEVAGVLFALCDSSIPGRPEGALDDETLHWLDAELRHARDRPAFVAFHHPPVTLGLPLVDEIRLGTSDRLADLLDAHPQVVAVLCGHAHTASATMFAGRPLLVAPGVASTVKLPSEQLPGLDRDLPPAFAFHLLDDDLRLTTHYRALG